MHHMKKFRSFIFVLFLALLLGAPATGLAAYFENTGVQTTTVKSTAQVALKKPALKLEWNNSLNKVVFNSETKEVELVGNVRYVDVYISTRDYRVSKINLLINTGKQGDFLNSTEFRVASSFNMDKSPQFSNYMTSFYVPVSAKTPIAKNTTKKIGTIKLVASPSVNEARISFGFTAFPNPSTQIFSPDYKKGNTSVLGGTSALTHVFKVY